MAKTPSGNRLPEMISRLEKAFGQAESELVENGEYTVFRAIYGLWRFEWFENDGGSREIRDILVHLATLSSLDRREFELCLGELVENWFVPGLLASKDKQLAGGDRIAGRQVLQLVRSWSSEQRVVVAEWLSASAELLERDDISDLESVESLRELSSWILSCCGH